MKVLEPTGLPNRLFFFDRLERRDGEAILQHVVLLENYLSRISITYR